VEDFHVAKAKSDFELQFQAVIGQPYMRWQRRICGVVWQVVTDVGEERPLGFHSIDDAQRIFYCRVCGVRLVPESVEKKNVQAFELMKRCFRYLAVIG
jgi:predicted TIM-barrel fold metal-dependent hydrolase